MSSRSATITTIPVKPRLSIDQRDEVKTPSDGGEAASNNDDSGDEGGGSAITWVTVLAAARKYRSCIIGVLVILIIFMVFYFLWTKDCFSGVPLLGSILSRGHDQASPHISPHMPPHMSSHASTDESINTSTQGPPQASHHSSGLAPGQAIAHGVPQTNPPQYTSPPGSTILSPAQEQKTGEEILAIMQGPPSVPRVAPAPMPTSPITSTPTSDIAAHTNSASIANPVDYVNPVNSIIPIPTFVTTTPFAEIGEHEKAETPINNITRIATSAATDVAREMTWDITREVNREVIDQHHVASASPIISPAISASEQGQIN